MKFGAFLKFDYQTVDGQLPVTGDQQVTIHGSDRAANCGKMRPSKFQSLKKKLVCLRRANFDLFKDFV